MPIDPEGVNVKRANTKDLFVEFYPEAAPQVSTPMSFVPVVKRLTNSITFAITFSTIAPTVLILFNVVLKNVFQWDPISDAVLITFTAASSVSAILQPIIGKILEKTIEKASIT